MECPNCLSYPLYHDAMLCVSRCSKCGFEISDREWLMAVNVCPQCNTHDRVQVEYGFEHKVRFRCHRCGHTGTTCYSMKDAKEVFSMPYKPLAMAVLDLAVPAAEVVANPKQTHSEILPRILSAFHAYSNYDNPTDYYKASVAVYKCVPHAARLLAMLYGVTKFNRRKLDERVNVIFMLLHQGGLCVERSLCETTRTRGD
jgi:Zn ribbon nucleic-acid-binding protein